LFNESFNLINLLWKACD